MFKVIVSIYSFLLLFYMMSYQFYSTSEREALLSFLIIIAVVTIIVAPSFGAKNRRKEMKNIKEREWQEGEYHNDFTRVGSAEDYTPVKPIDMAGNAVEHAREQLNEDLAKIAVYKVIEEEKGSDDEEK
ncbi:hypothetical protein [Halobacteriovorax sp. JY17]|uniref:hypothetical protein n=1 Tax=Halobacteriovorax sp. JY17 TaxID=2014617 RepID=UPI000C3DA205|nr:hypothetical protein [Halobacteriovorax sp. JY17]PIK15624.1 MAG: hypothetical protein CES88_02550 [Halobacteriovorax sp. JY17]